MGNLLILGGTAEARTLAEALATPEWRVTTSLAGRTVNPAQIPGQVRTGGFGGAEGLRTYLHSENIDAVIDATHPFAARISAHAADACRSAGVALLRLERPEWRPEDEDDWRMVSSVEGAVNASPTGGRLFVTLGRQEMAKFAGRDDIWFAARMIEAPDSPPANGLIVQDRPPFTYENERALMESHRITHLVSRNSGGGQTAPKLRAARDLGLPVIMIARPPALAGIPRVETPDQAIDWLISMT